MTCGSMQAVTVTTFKLDAFIYVPNALMRLSELFLLGFTCQTGCPDHQMVELVGAISILTGTSSDATEAFNTVCL